MGDLSIHLFGDFHIAYKNMCIEGFHQPRLQSLLAYLLLKRDRLLRRHAIAIQLWPDTTEGQAQTNLRQLLHRLRHLLPDAEQFIRVGTRTLQWHPWSPCSLDIATFEKTLVEATSAESNGQPFLAGLLYSQAIESYRGDLLYSCDDEWIIPERQRLRQLYLQTLERAVQLAEHERTYHTAIAFLRKIIRCEPLQESSYLRLMNLHLLNGDRASALQVYQDCAIILKQELGIIPNDALRTAYTHLVTYDVPTLSESHLSK